MPFHNLSPADTRQKRKREVAQQVFDLHQAFELKAFEFELAKLLRVALPRFGLDRFIVY